MSTMTDPLIIAEAPFATVPISIDRPADYAAHLYSDYAARASEASSFDAKTTRPLMTTDYSVDRNVNYRSITRSVFEGDKALATTTAATTNSRNQYTAFGSLNPQWDATGNLRSLGGLPLQYDSDNHLARAGTAVEITYAGSGRKVREKTGPTTRDYVLSGDQVIKEYENGTLTARYVHGRGPDETVRAELGTTTVYPLQDELGNVERLTDVSGATLQRYEYEGYGKFQVFGTSTLNWRWLFQGREYQPSLGAYDFRARTLWPELGRFGQEDPPGPVDHSNLYQASLAGWKTPGEHWELIAGKTLSIS